MVFGILELSLVMTILILAVIVYYLRIFYCMERRIERIEIHIEKILKKVMKEEVKIEKIEGMKK